MSLAGGLLPRGLIGVAVGCSTIGAPDRACTAIAVAGVQAVVRDSASGVRAASGARLVVRDGTYADSTSVPANRPDLDQFALAAAYERAGTYSVTVQKAGYRTWARDGVRVTKGECHVITAVLDVLLQR